jgi:hypothetical protein
MELYRRELLVARIISGVLRLRVNDASGQEITLVIRQPSRDARYFAQEVYQEMLERTLLEGVYTEEEIIKFLKDHRVWSEVLEAEMKNLEKEIEEFKVKLVPLANKPELQAGKLTLSKARERYKELSIKKHSYDHMTCEGAAAMAKMRYIVASSLYYKNGQPVLPCEELWDGAISHECSVLIDNAFEAFLGTRLEEVEIREIARTEPWLSYWSVKSHSSSIFGVPNVDLTEEQIRLLAWSQMYENIHQHPKCPPPEIINDDDLCDGWLIIQKRERDKELNKSRAEDNMNEKIKDSEEVYIVANSAEEAKAIEELNSADMKRIKQQRAAEIARKGQVQHVDLLDVRQEVQMEATRLKAEAIRGR